MADDDKLLQINRIRHFDGNEEYMVEWENRDLGARFMDYLRSQDTPVVVELKVDVFPDTELGGYYREHVRTRLEVKKVKTMDVTFYTLPPPEFERHEIEKKDGLSQATIGAILLLGGFAVALLIYLIR